LNSGTTGAFYVSPIRGLTGNSTLNYVNKWN
jgi:hypothetical protein